MLWSHSYTSLSVRTKFFFIPHCILKWALAASHKGSISAEHGIGAMKTHALHYSKSAVSIEWMKKIKKVFDPRGIMNPGKVLEMS